MAFRLKYWRLDKFISVFMIYFTRYFNKKKYFSKASLYSVRWYLEQEEFYRFVPKESPPSRVFAVTGIVVDVSLTTLYLFSLSTHSIHSFTISNFLKHNSASYWAVQFYLNCFDTHTGFCYFRLQNNLNLIGIESWIYFSTTTAQQSTNFNKDVPW